MIKNINLGVIGIDHGHIFDMLDEMLREGCTCDYFWTEGSPLTLKEFNQKYPNIKMKVQHVKHEVPKPPKQVDMKATNKKEKETITGKPQTTPTDMRLKSLLPTDLNKKIKKENSKNKTHQVGCQSH